MASSNSAPRCLRQIKASTAAQATHDLFGYIIVTIPNEPMACATAGQVAGLQMGAMTHLQLGGHTSICCSATNNVSLDEDGILYSEPSLRLGAACASVGKSVVQHSLGFGLAKLDIRITQPGQTCDQPTPVYGHMLPGRIAGSSRHQAGTLALPATPALRRPDPAPRRPAAAPPRPPRPPSTPCHPPRRTRKTMASSAAES
jgi:hypothetical protein